MCYFVPTNTEILIQALSPVLTMMAIRQLVMILSIAVNSELYQLFLRFTKVKLFLLITPPRTMFNMMGTLVLQKVQR